MIDLSFNDEDAGRYPVIRWRGAGDVTITIPTPLDCHYLSDESWAGGYDSVQAPSSGLAVGTAEWSGHGVTFALTDSWQQVGQDRLRLERRLAVGADGAAGTKAGENGFNLLLSFSLDPAGEWRFFAPGMIYSPSQYTGPQLMTFRRRASGLSVGGRLPPGRRVASCA